MPLNLLKIRIHFINKKISLLHFLLKKLFKFLKHLGRGSNLFLKIQIFFLNKPTLPWKVGVKFTEQTTGQIPRSVLDNFNDEKVRELVTIQT